MGEAMAGEGMVVHGSFSSERSSPNSHHQAPGRHECLTPGTHGVGWTEDPATQRESPRKGGGMRLGWMKKDEAFCKFQDIQFNVKPALLSLR